MGQLRVVWRAVWETIGILHLWLVGLAVEAALALTLSDGTALSPLARWGFRAAMVLVAVAVLLLTWRIVDRWREDVP
jgi:hypothetical protein